MCVAYDGTAYSGWQVQDNAPTIEGELNKALTNLTGTPTEVIGASRTDAGVHSLSSMCVFDTDMKMPADKYSFALNTRLPEDIRVVWSREVTQDFHPRHCYCGRDYQACHRWYRRSDRRKSDHRILHQQCRDSVLCGVRNYGRFCCRRHSGINRFR